MVCGKAVGSKAISTCHNSQKGLLCPGENRTNVDALCSLTQPSPWEQCKTQNNLFRSSQELKFVAVGGIPGAEQGLAWQIFVNFSCSQEGTAAGLCSGAACWKYIPVYPPFCLHLQSKVAIFKRNEVQGTGITAFL